MAVISPKLIDNSTILRTTGAFIAIFSLAIGLLVLYVIPAACSFVGSLQLLILSLLFSAGVITFLVGTAFSWKRRKD